MKKSVFNNFLWRLFERLGAQGVTLIVSIVLARILEPSVYGSIAIVTVIVNFLQLFVDSGLGTALIQKKDPDELDYSSVLYFKMCTCIIIYLLLFLSAPFISNFYKDESLIPVIRFLGITIIIASIKNVEQAYVSKNMMFKCFFYSTLVGTGVSAIVGIVMAYSGFGIWALVAQSVSNNLIDTIILWFTVKWRPQKCFSFERIKNLSKFGWRIFIASLLDNIYENIRQLIIGRVYSAEGLAYYNKGKQFPQLAVLNINNALDSVLLPSMSNDQDNILSVKRLVRRSITYGSYFLVPLMFGLFASSHSVICILLTDKWEASVKYMQIFCLAFAFYPINTSSTNGIKSLGYSDVFLKCEILKKSIGLCLIVVCTVISIKAMAISFLLCSVLNVVINIWPNKKYLNYSLKEQVKDIFPIIGMALLMLFIIYPINFLFTNEWLKLISISVAGMIVYFAESIVFKVEAFYYFKDKAYHMIFKKKEH